MGAKGQNFSHITHNYYTGTTGVATDGTTPIKNVLSPELKAAYNIYPLSLFGATAPIYMYGSTVGRDGINFPTAVVEVDGDDPICIKICKLNKEETKFVVMSFVDGGALEATVVDISGTTPTCGTITALNALDTDSANICAIGTAGTHFAVIYRDEGGYDYVYGKICSVSGTTITQGTEKALDGTDVGIENIAPAVYGVCEPRAGVLFFTWCDSDDDIAAVAAPYSGVTIGDLGTQNEISADAGTELACCKIYEGGVMVAYQDAGDTDFIHARAATVSAAGVIGTWGTEFDILATDATATYISLKFVESGKAIIFGEDASNDPFAQVLICAATTITRGTKKVFLAGTTTDIGGAMIDNTQGIIKYDQGTYGDCVRFSMDSGATGTTITADTYIDRFVDSTSAGGGTGGIACTSNGKCVIAYQDADSDLGIKVGQYYEDAIIDIRSATTVMPYKLVLVPEQNKIETEAKR